VVVLNKSRQGDKIAVTLPDYVSLKNPKTILGHKFDITGNQLTVEMSAVSFEVVY
jgi:hypothetical protein